MASHVERAARDVRESREKIAGLLASSEGTGSGASRIEQVWRDARASWNDEVAQHIEATAIKPLVAEAAAIVSALKKIEERLERLRARQHD